MKSVIKYGLDTCTKCLKCVKSCPTGAISQKDGKIKIDDEICVNCGRCIKECYHRGLEALRSPITKIAEYDYTVCLIPSSVAHNFTSNSEIEEAFYAIKELGFDEVFDLSGYEGALFEKYREYAEKTAEPVIASFCPVVNNLVRIKYQLLESDLIPYNYASEIAAKELKEKLKDKGNVGIFNLVECEAKLALARHPFNSEYYVDHALAIADVLPLIKLTNLENKRIRVNLSKTGVNCSNTVSNPGTEDIIVADGYEKVNAILDSAEFGLLTDVKLMMLYPCFNGCIGGHLTWGNCFLTCKNFHKLQLKDEVQEVTLSQITRTTDGDVKQARALKDRLTFFKKVNETLEKLPGYDCSACGLQTCRIMAEEIVAGNKTIEECRVHRALEVINESK
ncbi:MAG: 4Fe-4S binding protein [Erysipelotrichaceae bacterium]|nr:4Fe-4S binding protein [Erysipelotrichaceae bacterium]